MLLQMRAETWAGVRGRLTVPAHEIERIEGDLRDGKTANLGALETTIDLDENLHRRRPIVGEQVSILGQNHCFTVTFVDDRAKTFNAEHANTKFSLKNLRGEQSFLPSQEIIPTPPGIRDSSPNGQ